MKASSGKCKVHGVAYIKMYLSYGITAYMTLCHLVYVYKSKVWCWMGLSLSPTSVN